MYVQELMLVALNLHLADSLEVMVCLLLKELNNMKQTIKIEVPDGKKAVWKDGKVVFEDIKPQLPKTWEEFCKSKPRIGCYYIKNNSEIGCAAVAPNRMPNEDANLLPCKEAAEQHLALMQLHQLRDCYRQGWNPNYTDGSPKACIEKCNNAHTIVISIQCSFFLSFPTRELAEEFLNNFESLIKQAGDLI